MIEPDDCTSLRYCKPHDHCRDCSHARFYGEVTAKGRMWNFEFSPMYGVFFLTKKNEPLKIQPSEGHPVWIEFEKWYKNKFEAK